MREVISNRLSAISIRDLLLVEAVAQRGSFRQAAEAIGISTSGLSHQIRKVEDIFGAAIFERGTRVTLTTSGKMVLEAIADTLASATRLEALRDQPSMPLGAVLRIGVITSLAPGDLVRIVEACRRNSPQTRLEIVSGKHQGLLRRLQHREIDLLITAEDELPVGLCQTELIAEGFVLLVNPAIGVPELSCPGSCQPSLLPISEDDFVPPRISTGLSALINSSLTRAFGLSVEHRIALVSAGYGHALLPKGWVQGIPARHTTAIMDLPAALSDKRTLRSIWRNSFAIGAEVAALFHAELNIV
ncbi:LysR family transcriptional regulator [Paracoccus sp. TOH]|uniref:LysR family transcriptional regulator n=1 Tax=Paracoccus sp. TOH TaxID=1263728 RepID=UPI0025B08724|nr:LysR family transcriptional regulator [Paracoccus sp. TOH]WJS85268.1 LysR family transcriptional regulator [Paracoccus sp. TOH]